MATKEDKRGLKFDPTPEAVESWQQENKSQQSAETDDWQVSLERPTAPDYTNFGAAWQNGGTGANVDESTAPKTMRTATPYDIYSGSTNKDAIDWLNKQMAKYKEESDAEREVREVREKKVGVMGRIANMLANMHRAYSYQRGVQPMQIQDATGRIQERYETERAKRDADRDKYMAYALKKAELEKQDRDFAIKGELARKAAEKEAAKQQREDELADAKRKKLAAEGLKNDAMAAYWQAKADALEAGDPLDVALKKAKIAQANAIADKARRMGTSSWHSGSGGKSGYEYLDENGVLRRDAPSASSAANLNQYYGHDNIPYEEEKKNERVDLTGTTTTKNTTTKVRTLPAGGGAKKKSAKSKFSIHN